MHPSTRVEGFGAFFKRYAKSWQHGVATAALTAFGMLTVVNRLFVVVALVAYAAPPLVLYLRVPSTRAESDEGRPARTDEQSVESTHRDVGPASEGTSEPASGGESEPASECGEGSTWTTSTVPTDETLHDVAVDSENAYAVGSGGSLVADRGDGWGVVVADGPGAQSNALHGVDTTSEGAVWFAGDGGAVGRFDTTTARHVDYSAPNDDTTNVTALAATGSGGEETVLLADGSGWIRRGRYRDGELAWDDSVTPGSGSSLADVALSTDLTGYVCDTNQCVFRTDDGGRTFRRVGVDADGTLVAVSAPDSARCLVCDDDGVVYQYDGRQWTPERLCDAPLSGLATTRERGLIGGDGGTVFERGAESRRWRRSSTPTAVTFRGAALGRTRAVAVGADGVVVERALEHRDTGES